MKKKNKINTKKKLLGFCKANMKEPTMARTILDKARIQKRYSKSYPFDPLNVRKILMNSPDFTIVDEKRHIGLWVYKPAINFIDEFELMKGDYNVY